MSVSLDVESTNEWFENVDGMPVGSLMFTAGTIGDRTGIPVIVRRPHRPEWGPIKHCVYLIVYTHNRVTPNGALYVGRFKDKPNNSTYCLGSPYVGRGYILERIGFKFQDYCTFEDLLYHAQFIDHIECWYCSEDEYKSSESEAIRYFAQTYGISPLVLQHSEPNSFTSLFVRPDGLLLNCTDNGMQSCKTPSTVDAHRDGSRKAAQVLKDIGYYGSPEHKAACSKGALSLTSEQRSRMGHIGVSKLTPEQLSKAASKCVQTRKSSDGYGFSESGLESLRQVKRQRDVNGKFSSVSLLFYFQGIIYLVSEGVRSCARKASEITGIYVAASSLSNSLKRNHGDTLYKGIHFKYASLLTEDELKNAIYL